FGLRERDRGWSRPGISCVGGLWLAHRTYCGPFRPPMGDRPTAAAVTVRGRIGPASTRTPAAPRGLAARARERPRKPASCTVRRRPEVHPGVGELGDLVLPEDAYPLFGFRSPPDCDRFRCEQTAPVRCR